MRQFEIYKLMLPQAYIFSNSKTFRSDRQCTKSSMLEVVNTTSLLLGGIILASLYLYFHVTYSYWKKRGVPTIPTIPPFGNFAEAFLFKNNSAVTISSFYNKFEGEKLAGLYRFSTPALMLRDPELIKDVMVKDFKNFYSRGIEPDLKRNPLLENLFAISGSKWRNLRVKLTPTFTSEKMKMMFPIVASTGEILEACLEDPAEQGQVIEIGDILSNYTTDNIASCAFGIQCNCLKNPNAEFRVWGRKIFTPSIETFLRSMILSIPTLQRFLRFKFLPKDVNDYFIQMVRETVDYREKNNVQRKDFLQLMIQLKNKTLGTIRSDDMEGLNSNVPLEVTMEFLAAQAFVFYAAGFETSSSTMTFCLYELALNPDIQDKVRKDIDIMLEKHNGKVEYEAIMKMEYLEKVVNETLRKHPVVPLLTRECTKSTKLQGTDVTVEKGTPIFIPIYGLHHDPEYFPDPEKFDPERFSEEEKQKRPHYSYLPFGEGPRICIEAYSASEIRPQIIATNPKRWNVAENHKKKRPGCQIKDDERLNTGQPSIGHNIMLDVCDYSSFLLGGIVLASLYVYFRVKYSYWSKKGVPTIKPTPPFGNFGQVFLFKTNALVCINWLYNKFEGHRLAGLYRFTTPAIMIRDPDLIKEVLVKDFKHFHNRGIEVDLKLNPLLDNIFILSGTKWKNLRMKLTPTFTSEKMKMMFPIVASIGDELKALLEKSAGQGQVIEVADILSRYTTDVIASCAFGIQCNCLKDSNAEFREWGRKFFNPSVKTFFRSLTLSMSSLNRYLKIPLVPLDINKYFTDMLRETVEYREKNGVQRKDFLQLMIQLKNKTLEGVDDEAILKATTNEFDELPANGNSEVTMHVMAAQAFMFYVAGFETSSTTMTFCLYELALNPKIQDKVWEEIDDMFKKQNGKLKYDALVQLEYLDKVLNDLVVEKGTPIMVPVYGLHHDPQYFPDPERFDPERFTEEEKRKRPHYCYLPFGEGPRICIGMRFALMQTKIGLISVLSNYEVQVSEKTPVPMKYDPKSLFIAPKGGMWLKITKRRNKFTNCS
ncbi:hypothetical protein C0J52_20552 [Blattella germanica]|nr:hypothetical protein C0J52_20552 [Blattella germanica]